jgi:DNA polymerase-4
MDMTKIIVCVDMDAYFASVEQLDNPELRGKPIAVTGAGERTIITTASYEARAYGVKTGMTTYEAKRLCPQIILVVGNNRKYAETCKQLEEICLRFTPETETYSIDEVFLDITGSHHLFCGPVELAKGIKVSVKTELGLTCTVGIGPNILVAKLASDLAKPDGLRWIDEAAIPSALETLPVKKLWGIGAPHREETPGDGHHYLRTARKGIPPPSRQAIRSLRIRSQGNGQRGIGTAPGGCLSGPEVDRSQHHTSTGHLETGGDGKLPPPPE